MIIDLCRNCPGRFSGDCICCEEDFDPRGGDYDEDEFADERPEDFGPEED